LKVGGGLETFVISFPDSITELRDLTGMCEQTIKDSQKQRFTVEFIRTEPQMAWYAIYAPDPYSLCSSLSNLPASSF
jgi:hypothetical protein